MSFYLRNALAAVKGRRWPGLVPQRRQLNCHTASVCKVHRLTYARTYPTVLVLPDGSSIAMRYSEPRKIIRLPLDLSTLTEEERRVRLEKRKPRKKLKIVEDVEDSFDVNKYVKYIKKV
ncbi:large ribosomal subunit protein mL55 [Bacillus rossius redtenbacheri]|uniref:large ribosomal subunit protein mL55 n=1 Tax=Bacillus rossius redtenbacheri TaxID=93214 RepID=UPI002FDD4C31